MPLTGRGGGGGGGGGNRQMNGGAVPNIDEIMRALEGGSKLTRFYHRRRPEFRMFRVRLETRQLIWTRSIGGKAEGKGQ
jgi:hypothetical protein